MTLSASAYIEKNKLASTGVWIILLEITLPDTTVLRICYNTEDITWNSNVWTAFPFELDEIGDTSKGEVPSLVVRVSNVTRAIQSYLETTDGGVGSTVKIMVVHSDHLELTSPEIELEYEVIETNSDNMWVSFTLGASNPYRNRFPRNRVMKNFCRYKVFKGDQCGYVGAETLCNRTLSRCRELNNSDRFGGAPGVGSRGLVV